MRILLLGGTGEARRLAETLALRPDLSTILSFAGRTDIPADQPVPYRVGGFGGSDGLRRYLSAEHIDGVIDATHPFAAQMSANAAAACRADGVPLARLLRPAWEAQAGDRWHRVGGFEDAVDALGTAPRGVFLTIGQGGLEHFEAAPQHRYLVRSIGAPERFVVPDADILLDRPPYDEASEAQLMREQRIEILVTKNSGGSATSAKLAAARQLGLPVVMIERPAMADDVPILSDEAGVLAWLGSRQAERGV